VDEYRNPKELTKLVLVAHRVLFGTATAVVYPSERAAFLSAFARASHDIPDAWNRKSKDELCDAIARLTVAIGHAYQGSRETAFWVADHLLSKAGYQLPGDDLQLAHDLLDVAVQSKRDTEAAEVFKRHWY
jgi:hypothetical protein